MSLCLINPLNAKLNPTCHLLALLGAHHILHISGIRVKHGGVDVFFRSAGGERSDLRPRHRVMYKAGCALGLVCTLCTREKIVLLPRIELYSPVVSYPGSFSDMWSMQKTREVIFLLLC